MNNDTVNRTTIKLGDLLPLLTTDTGELRPFRIYDLSTHVSLYVSGNADEFRARESHCCDHLDIEGISQVGSEMLLLIRDEFCG